jgi:hypothetical protein
VEEIHLGPIAGRIIADYIFESSTDALTNVETFLPDRFANLSLVDFYASGQRVEE